MVYNHVLDIDWGAMVGCDDYTGLEALRFIGSRQQASSFLHSKLDVIWLDMRIVILLHQPQRKIVEVH